MKLKVYLAIALVFLLGMLSGGLLVAQLAKSRVQTLTAGSTEDISEIVLKVLDRDLELSKEQRETVSAILTEAVEEVDPMRAEMRSRAFKVIDKYQMQIGRGLNAEQRKELEEMVGKIKKRANL